MGIVSKRPRWSYLTNAIIVGVMNVAFLWINDWDVVNTYTFGKHQPVYLVIFKFLYLMWGVYNLIEYINYNRVAKPPVDTNEDEFNDNDQYYDR